MKNKMEYNKKRSEALPMLLESITSDNNNKDFSSTKIIKDMESKVEDGNIQTVSYKNTNGVLQNSGRHNSLPNGKSALPHNTNFANKLPINRFSSVASSNVSCRFDNDGSVINLVNTKNKNNRLLPFWCKSSLIVTTVIILLVVICTLATLYILEMRRYKTVEIKINKPTKATSPVRSCFKQAIPFEIPNIQVEPHVLNAIENFQRDLATNIPKHHGPYHAFSVNVRYMEKEIWSYNYGTLNFLNKESHLPTNDTPYPVASTSKLFTIIMLEKLLEKGVIKNIDDPLNDYNKEFLINNPFGNTNITFREITCMMSGMPREAPCYPINKVNLCPFNSTIMFERIGNLSLVLEPGRVPSYSNLAVAVLGRTLENVIGSQTYEEWIRKYIINPLKLTNTGFDIQNRTNEIPTSSTYGNKSATLYEWGWLNPTAGMYSSINDLSKLASMFFGYSKTFRLSKSSRQRMFRSAHIWSDHKIQSCPFETYPIRVNDTTDLAYLNYEKAGSSIGYASRFCLVPELKLNINVLVASPDESAAWFLRNSLLNSFVPAFDKLLKTKNKATFQYQVPPNPEYYTGSYELKTYWPLILNPCIITYENGILTMQLEWFKVDMTHIEGHTLKPFNDVEDCLIVASGLLGDKYIFKEPKNNDTKSNEFYVKSIASYGYARFERIK